MGFIASQDNREKLKSEKGKSKKQEQMKSTLKTLKKLKPSIKNAFEITKIIANLKIGDTYETEKFKISFESIDQKSKKNFQAVIGKFIIENQNGVVDILNPELRIYNQPNIVTSEADIKTNLFTDKFMTMNVVQNQEYFNIRYQVKPFMIWIWFSVLLISFGGLLSFVRKRYES